MEMMIASHRSSVFSSERLKVGIFIVRARVMAVAVPPLTTRSARGPRKGRNRPGYRGFAVDLLAIMGVEETRGLAARFPVWVTKRGGDFGLERWGEEGRGVAIKALPREENFLFSVGAVGSFLKSGVCAGGTATAEEKATLGEEGGELGENALGRKRCISRANTGVGG